MTEAETIARTLGACRWTYANEGDLQLALWRVLEEKWPGTFTREHWFNGTERIDFFAPRLGVGIEVKAYRAGGTGPKVLAQMERYAALDAVRELVLFGGSPAVIAGFPKELLGKPVVAICAKGRLM